MSTEPGQAHAKQFWGYASIEQYKVTDNILEWEAPHSNPEHVARMRAFMAQITPEYEAARPNYTGVDRHGKPRAFRNWCDKSVADMAVATKSERLYRLVYNQTSPYVHGSAWSLRAVGVFTTRGYDARRALIDTATLIRSTLVVWFEWAAFCDDELGWTLRAGLDDLKRRLDELQASLDRTASA